MLKREITYEDFNGNSVTDTFYFNLTKSELIEMEAKYKGGLEAIIIQIVETQDKQKLINIFKDVILASYGKKSEDGRRFIKSDELREEFTQTPAYDIFFFELATNAEKGAEFIKGILPKDFEEEMKKLGGGTLQPPSVQSTPSL